MSEELKLPDWLTNLDPATFAELVAANMKPALPSFFHNTDKLPALFEALAGAQAEYLPVVRDKEVVQRLKNKETGAETGKTITFKYAELAQILSATTPALSKHGLTFTQPIETREHDGALIVVSILGHKDGAMVVSRMQVPAANSMTQMGGFISYIRRYAAGPILGVSAEDDADNHGGDGGDDTGSEEFQRGYSNAEQGGGRTSQAAPAAKRAAPARKSASAATAGNIVPNQVKFLEQKLGALKLTKDAQADFFTRMELEKFDTNITLVRFAELQKELDRMRDA